ncbi:DUF4365 domain-containing protein [Curtobacterium sp. 458]|uniref:DUF4365 domain-containing protein n=1 Tax=Curtobacterium sp. 458 TaxID=3050069 RepID=UPI0025B54D4F|nr:DUF4365 domain-containing protein [Curtobacterium sp. 458]WJY00843.1 DUF4365 domain-containing protein [Curtobacterium sp. 458]
MSTARRPSLPRVQDTDFVEQAGVLTVAGIVNQARCIWREVLHRDVGIDGHIEYVTPDGEATGRTVAVQVKSGASRFANTTTDSVRFTPEAKHRQYWESYPLPVILVLHNPETMETLWTDAREALRVHDENTTLEISRRNTFDPEGVLAALATSGPLPSAGFDVDWILQAMAQPDMEAQGLTFLDMFAQGMTDVARSIWISVEVTDQILDIKSATWEPPGYGFGAHEFAFLDRYVDFLVAHDLARLDYATWRETTLSRQMVAKLMAPLTTKGRAVRDAIIALDSQLTVPEEPRQFPAIQERFVQMLFNPSWVDEAAVRQARIDRISATLRAAPGSAA